MKIKKTIPNPVSNETSELWKEFFKRLLYIGLCIIIICLFANNNDAFRLVPLPFLFIALYQIIAIIKVCEYLINEYFPLKTPSNKIAKPLDKFFHYFALTIFFSGLLGLIFEIRNFDRTINGAVFFRNTCFIGIGIGIAFAVLLKILSPSVYDENNRRYTVISGFILGFFLLTPSVSSFVNHTLADEQRVCKNFTITETRITKKRSKEYFVYLDMEDHRNERFSVNKNKTFYKGEQIELCILKGRLGYDYVVEFNKMTK
ncbi:hypothetical protein [Flavobacterium gelatinilyticum]|uniref:hypothetical protein n=1 Tax=Flavobacterium gelatinilyticum TaxID=3003260 RepID=UPI00248155BC|nr:hypothetical protein [Flavobacterium gelatinilyticum]